MGGKLTRRSWDAVIAELAERQHGVVSRSQLRGLGMGRTAIEGRLRRGSLHRIHRGVYMVGHRRISRKGRWMAAVLAAAPDGVVSHRAAGCLHELLPPGLFRVEVTCPRGRRARLPGIVCHEADLLADELTELDAIAVTSAFRTLFDLAAVLTPRQLERAWSELQVKGLADPVPMAVHLERHRGRRGVGALRRLIGSIEEAPVTRSELEERFLALLRAAGLALPRFNATLHLRGRFLEVDCLWEDQRLIVELDGAAVHGTARSFQLDRHRDRVLLAEGYRTIRITWEQLRAEPTQVVADLRSALALYP